MNREAERLTGWQQAEAAGRTLTEVFQILHEVADGNADRKGQRAVRGQQLAELDVQFLRTFQALVRGQESQHVVATGIDQHTVVRVDDQLCFAREPSQSLREL